MVKKCSCDIFWYCTHFSSRRFTCLCLFVCESQGVYEFVVVCLHWFQTQTHAGFHACPVSEALSCSCNKSRTECAAILSRRAVASTESAWYVLAFGLVFFNPALPFRCFVMNVTENLNTFQPKVSNTSEISLDLKEWIATALSLICFGFSGMSNLFCAETWVQRPLQCLSEARCVWHLPWWWNELSDSLTEGWGGETSCSCKDKWRLERNIGDICRQHNELFNYMLIWQPITLAIYLPLANSVPHQSQPWKWEQAKLVDRICEGNTASIFRKFLVLTSFTQACSHFSSLSVQPNKLVCTTFSQLCPMSFAALSDDHWQFMYSYLSLQATPMLSRYQRKHTTSKWSKPRRYLEHL